ncbi:MarR family winged helix-turn-helix transcriptional regulator [Streptomyces sp. NBC_00829]|uniref:MarR family winged helix-turn-helix transcriptional regulator n=1 Tax=Streptomyces sp. NBC_00829 TaxID=2903679 RepID=UPI003866FBF4
MNRKRRKKGEGMGDEAAWLSERELRAWKNLLAVNSIIGRSVEQQLKDAAGLSHPQYEVLTRLGDAPGGELRMTELAGAALTSKSGLTYQVTQLEKAGLIRRSSCPSDDRGVVAVLTELGKERLRAAAPGHAALVRELFVDGLGEREFDSLAAGLEALLDRLRGRCSS